MKDKILILIAFALLVFSCSSSMEEQMSALNKSEKLVKEALDKGEKGALEEALAIYRELESEKSLLSGYFYLNMGQMYGLQGNIGEAAASFEKGLLLEPLNRRLYQARKQVLNGKGINNSDSLILKSTDTLFRIIPPFWLIILMILTIASFIVWFVFRKGKLGLSFIIAAYLILALVYGVFRENVPLHGVVTESVEMKKGDSRAYATIEILKPGQKVIYKEERSGWSRIETSGGESGWIESDTLSLIIIR